MKPNYDYTVSDNIINFTYPILTGTEILVDYLPVNVSVPSAITYDVTEITQTSAQFHGYISSTGGTTLTQRGFVYSQSPNPTLNDNIISIEGQAGHMYSTPTLTEGEYYVRAFATNSLGTSYGNQVSFRTLDQSMSTILDGLAAVWELDDNSNDSYASLDASTIGTYQIGKLGKSLQLTSGQELSAPYSPNLTTNDFTVAFWVKVDNPATTAVATGAGGSGYSSGWSMYRSSTGAMTFRWGNGTAFRTNIAGGSVPLSQWAHTAITLKSDTFRLYINNQQVAYFPDADFGYHATPENYPLRFGYVSGITALEGELDNIFCHSRALTTVELSDLYNDGTGKTYINLTDGEEPQAPEEGGTTDLDWFTEPTDPGTGTFYVSSSTGNDNNPGTYQQPWKTLNKVSNTTLSAGETVLLKRNDVWEESLTLNGSGDLNNPITIGAYGSGNKPKIMGSVPVTGWTLHSGSIYKATVNSTVTQVFVDNERQRVARWPNTGYSYITDTIDSDTFTADQLNGTINYSGAKVFARTYYYTTDLLNVLSSNNQTINISSPPRLKLRPNYGFFVMNKLELLDQPGEWYYDNVSHALYLYAPGGVNPSSLEVRASVLGGGIWVNGNDNVKIVNLHFAHQKDNGIGCSSSVSGMEITGCVFENMESHGIISEITSPNWKVTKKQTMGDEWSRH